jgi:hypothetical protein
MFNPVSSNNIFYDSLCNQGDEISIHNDTYLFLLDFFQKSKSLCLEILYNSRMNLKK